MYFLNFLLRRIEGVLFLLLALLLLPMLAVHMLVGLLCGSGQVLRSSRRILKRWFKFVLFGFAPIRLVWPFTFKLEKISDLWRHILLLELFDFYNVSSKQAERVDEIREGMSVLVVKLAHFGDALHIFPMLRSLRSQVPSAQIDVLVGPWCEALVNVMPGVDHALIYRPSLALFHRNSTKGKMTLSDEIRFLHGLRKKKYDVVFSTSTTNISEVLLWAASRPRLWIGCDTDAVNLYGLSNGVTVRYDEAEYEASRVSNLLTMAGLEKGGDKLEYPLPKDVENYADIRLDLHNGSAHVAVIAPGAGWEGKRWDVNRFAEACRWMHEAKGLCIVFAGTKEERPLCSEIIIRAGIHAENIAGETTLSQLACVIKNAAVFIGNDSGPMHLAVAYDIPTVAFFGPTTASKWLPDRPHCAALQADFDCAGCIGWHVRASCLQDHECMKQISVEGFKKEFERVSSIKTTKVHAP